MAHPDVKGYEREIRSAQLAIVSTQKHFSPTLSSRIFRRKTFTPAYVWVRTSCLLALRETASAIRCVFPNPAGATTYPVPRHVARTSERSGTIDPSAQIVDSTHEVGITNCGIIEICGDCCDPSLRLALAFEPVAGFCGLSEGLS